MSKILHYIQQNLKAPKNAYNDFAKFKYRKAEDILTALKPLLAEHEATVLIEDDIKLIGDRFYIEAVVTLYDSEGKVLATSKAFAREELTKKGSDASQITGMASSYARKYALNGMFLIDDTEDADGYDNSQDQNNSHSEKPVNNLATEAQVKHIYTLITTKNQDEAFIKNHYKIESMKDLSSASASKLIEWLKGL